MKTKSFPTFFPTWSLNFQIADTCTHWVPIFRYVVLVNCMAWHCDKENNVVYTNVTWSLAFCPKQTAHNRCSRCYVVPLFSSKKRELFTEDNLGRSSDAFPPFSRQMRLSFQCRTMCFQCRTIFVSNLLAHLVSAVSPWFINIYSFVYVYCCK